MVVYSYVIEHDFGLAPNPFGRYCTLAVCKLKIRGSSKLKIGDWILGTGSKAIEMSTGKKGLRKKLIYAMQVTEKITFDDYWSDPRFQYKKPRMNGSRVAMFGDNFYHTDENGNWNLSLMDPEGRPALTLPKVIFAISVRSVLSLGVEQLVIDSPTLDIRRTENGDWRIAGLALKKDNSPDSPFADWVFAQKEILVQQGTVVWTDEFNPLSRDKSALNLNQVSWVLRNSARHHQWRAQEQGHRDLVRSHGADCRRDGRAGRRQGRLCDAARQQAVGGDAPLGDDAGPVPQPHPRRSRTQRRHRGVVRRGP